MSYSARVGERIKIARNRKDITQEQLGKALKVSGGNVSHMELGRRKITVEDVFIVAKELKVDIRELFPDIASIEVENLSYKEVVRFQMNGKTFAMCEVISPS